MDERRFMYALYNSDEGTSGPRPSLSFHESALGSHRIASPALGTIRLFNYTCCRNGREPTHLVVQGDTPATPGSAWLLPRVATLSSTVLGPCKCKVGPFKNLHTVLERLSTPNYPQRTSQHPHPQEMTGVWIMWGFFFLNIALSTLYTLSLPFLA
ncbi:hypothetical protein BJ322DRAFT_336940 [Thelephora terrestris]|uniref:Uncharacterized protein n=1 Tax=Thelephora terrestris TaxID=56493 RepID=A0A9P6L2T7_9AGAM|nr:hypothetical protein BJ322DRAFT_336940 [Thelephora terrestris]